MKWILSLLEDDRIFPVQPSSWYKIELGRLDVPFPSNYRDVVNDIFRRLFRVYAHIYHSHMPFICSLQLDSQFFFSLKHFIHFVDQFSLVSPIDILSLRDVLFELTPNLLSRLLKHFVEIEWNYYIVVQQMNVLPDRREKLKIQRIDTGMTSILSTSVIENSSPYYPSENERELGSSIPLSFSHVGISSQNNIFCNAVNRRSIYKLSEN